MESCPYEHEQIVRQIRKEAEAAWSAKDHGRIGELYRPIDDELTEFEKKRLAYAKHMKVCEHAANYGAERFGCFHLISLL